MFNFKNYKRLNILNIFENNFKVNFKENYNFIIFNKKKKMNKNIFFKKNRILFIIIEYKKIKILKILYFFWFIFFNNIKIKKNFILVYKFKKYCRANNFFPDWPGNFREFNFFESLLFWGKRFFSIIFFIKYLEFIFIKIK